MHNYHTLCYDSNSEEAHNNVIYVTILDMKCYNDYMIIMCDMLTPSPSVNNEFHELHYMNWDLVYEEINDEIFVQELVY